MISLPRNTQTNNLNSIFSGVGNNGGDGLVIARILQQRVAMLRSLLLSIKMLPDDCAHNLRRIKAEKIH